MSLIDVDGDPWLREHEDCVRLSRDIAAQLTDRDSETPRSNAYAKISASVLIRLRQFSSEVQQLHDKLSVIANNGTLTPHEIERRRRLVELLRTGERQLQQRFNARDYDYDERRPQLMGSRASGGKIFADMGTTGWGNEPEQPSGTYDVEQAQRMTQQVIKEQDAGLEELSKIISRQKDIARTIGDEVETQNEILDDLADGIDRTTVGLINETRQVRTIARKDSTCGYWVVIILLFIAIVVIAVL